MRKRITHLCRGFPCFPEALIPADEEHFPLARVLIRLRHEFVQVRQEASDPCIFEDAADDSNPTSEGPHGWQALILWTTRQPVRLLPPTLTGCSAAQSLL